MTSVDQRKAPLSSRIQRLWPVVPMLAWAIYAGTKDHHPDTSASQAAEGDTAAAITTSPYHIVGAHKKDHEGVYLSARPFLSAEHIGQKLLDGAQVEVSCQTEGDVVAHTDTWDKVVLYDSLTDRFRAAYVPDAFVDTAKDLAPDADYPSCA